MCWYSHCPPQHPGGNSTRFREVQPQGPSPYSFVYHFDRNDTPPSQPLVIVRSIKPSLNRVNVPLNNKGNTNDA